eukprot:TRINITY_DN216_c0_g1_i1.p1 TRINITY_DN216_c0_g1~~TRINITY_DN216_c0_g1_i1.p1  ORF type:complete len:263 (-),score=33.15 TRINITY_DN216_c0_g1_i1:2165-2953(-)
MSILQPNASIRGLPHADPQHVASGFTLGDHHDPNDPLDVAHPAAPLSRHFHPYENNGGTVVSVSGADYTIVASDTRLGSGYSVPSRYVSRVLKLTDKAVLASSGMHTDIVILHKVLKIRLIQYKHRHRKDMTLEAISQLLSTMLYYRRFQPYYTFNVLGGLDENGQGWSYGYDAIGSHEKVRAVCSGTGQYLLQPVLDNQVEFRQMTPDPSRKELPLEPCVELVKDAFTSAGERDIYTGDTVEICRITSKGVEVEKFELRAD